jgi:ParB-like chromosome segregation protein Spo0J
MVAVPFHLISTADRMRRASPQQVASLADSMREVGLLHPLPVYPRPILVGSNFTPGYGLIAGLNRLEAARSLGWTEIECNVLELDDLHRQLAECDENLRGPKLSESELLRFTKRRKEAYLALHPQTKKGVAGANAANKAMGNATAKLSVASETKSFAADQAALTGKSERTIRRNAQRAEAIADDVLDRIDGTPLDTRKVTDELGKVPKEQQAARLDEIAERKAAYARLHEIGELDRAFKKWHADMMRVWLRGSADWRERSGIRLDERAPPVVMKAGDTFDLWHADLMRVWLRGSDNWRGRCGWRLDERAPPVKGAVVEPAVPKVVQPAAAPVPVDTTPREEAIKSLAARIKANAPRDYPVSNVTLLEEGLLPLEAIVILAAWIKARAKPDELPLIAAACTLVCVDLGAAIDDLDG